MLDLSNLEKYKENNRIEAKKATGGLPRSIWETYSAFANTLGGVILLGVEEREDKSLHPVDLTDTDWLLTDFWETINNPSKVSLNILTDKDVKVRISEGKRIIVINVPRAQRSEKPVYIEDNPFLGTYRRNGEGDYRCTPQEVAAMQRDALYKSNDILVLEDMDIDVFDYNSIASYRMRMNSSRPGHIWGTLDDIDFLQKLGAVGKGDDGRLHPTAAGLLMFGYEYEIVREFPSYFLDYQEKNDNDTGCVDRIVSSSGDWSGNIYDFYFRVYKKISKDINVSQNNAGDNDSPVHKALREALTNCLINADYYGRQGLVIVKRKSMITFSNPGGFRIDIEAAKSGGISDPRNTTLIRMFNLIDIGKRAGSGIPSIFHIWNLQGWKTPVITEEFKPERITLSLSLEEGDVADSNSVASNRIRDMQRDMQKDAIIEYLTDNVSAKAVDISEYIGAELKQTEILLGELVDDEIIVRDFGKQGKIYILKA